MAKFGNRRWLDEGHVLFWRRATINLAGQHKCSGIPSEEQGQKVWLRWARLQGKEGGAGGTLPNLSL